MNELEQKLSDAKSDVTDLIIDQLSGKKTYKKQPINQPTKSSLKIPALNHRLLFLIII